MKAVLEFDLPAEESEFILHKFGPKWQNVVFEITEAIRSKRKHGHDFRTADEVLDWVWKLLHSEMSEHGLDCNTDDGLL